MTLRDWLAHNEREPAKYEPAATDTVEWPEITVTEEPMSDDTTRRFLDAQQRIKLELIP
jgi:hypothetical protein